MLVVRFSSNGWVKKHVHLRTLPSVRSSEIIFQMFRKAIEFTVNECGATHIIGDIFLDKNLRDFKGHFYERMGAEVVHGPYADFRLPDSPRSLIFVLSIPFIFQREREEVGSKKRILQKVLKGLEQPVY